MVYRIVASRLGKRCLREPYSAQTRTCLRSSSAQILRPRAFSQLTTHLEEQNDASRSIKTSSNRTTTTSSSSPSPSESSASVSDLGPHDNWETDPDLSISKFSQLPSKEFGYNQHIVINEEFKEALRNILWKFRAPIRYAFAYGSGVFPQTAYKAASSGVSTLHPSPPEAISKIQGGNQKMIDFIFGVSYSQHWHSLNLQEHRDHYSALGSTGSYIVSKVQDSFGAGVYFNPYITVNGTLIKYGVVNIDTMCRDLSEWDTLYIAGRLQKPVKILRDNPSVRLANQVNLIGALRLALLLLPEEFTEQDLYTTIAGISYMGDPRMKVGGDNPQKVKNIVSNQLPDFRRLYAPLIDTLPNITFNDPATGQQDWVRDPEINAKLNQNMDPVTRGHMVRRLPNAFRQKLYFEYQAKFKIPRGEFNRMLQKTKDEDPDRIRRREGGPFEQRIARDVDGGGLREELNQVIEKTVAWPSFTQTLKAVATAGFSKSWRYASEKRSKAVAGKTAHTEEKSQTKTTDTEKKDS